MISAAAIMPDVDELRRKHQRWLLRYESRRLKEQLRVVRIQRQQARRAEEDPVQLRKAAMILLPRAIAALRLIAKGNEAAKRIAQAYLVTNESLITELINARIVTRSVGSA